MLGPKYIARHPCEKDPRREPNFRELSICPIVDVEIDAFLERLIIGDLLQC